MFLSRPDQDDQPSLQSEHAEPDISNLAAPQGPEGQAAVPAGGGEAWPGDQWAAVGGSGRQWAANVTNVVKPTRFTSPREDFCYKRRQSQPKNHCFRRKSPRIDDVCNIEAEIHTKNTSD